MCSCPSEHSAHSAAKTAPATRRGARPSRQAGAVFAQYRLRAHGRRAKRCCVRTVSFVAAHGRRAKAVLCLHSILRRARGTAIARRRCCVRTVSFMAAHGDRAKAVLCLHSILRGGARRSGEGGAVFAQYPSWRRTVIGRRRCCVRTVSFVAAHGDRAKAVLCLHVFCTVSFDRREGSSVSGCERLGRSMIAVEAPGWP